MRRSIPVANFQETARGEGRQKIAGSDDPVCLHEGAVISYPPIVTESRSPNGHALSTSARAMFVNHRATSKPMHSIELQKGCGVDEALPSVHPSWESAILGSNPT